MKKMQKINLLKKADVLNEKDMKLLIGGENDACGGGGFSLYSCAWSIEGGRAQHAWVCAGSLNEAEENLRKTIQSQLGEIKHTVCSNYR